MDWYGVPEFITNSCRKESSIKPISVTFSRDPLKPNTDLTTRAYFVDYLLLEFNGNCLLLVNGFEVANVSYSH